MWKLKMNSGVCGASVSSRAMTYLAIRTLAFLGIAFLSGCSDVFTERLASHPIACTERYVNETCAGFEFTLNKTTYKINRSRNEVVYMVSDFGPYWLTARFGIERIGFANSKMGQVK